MPDSRRKTPGRLATPIESSHTPIANGDVRDQRFRRQNRLPDASAFGAVFADARRSGDSLFTVLYRRSDQPTARLGLAVSKKHCRAAAGRNRIKRLIRESFRQHKAQLTGLDLVVMNTRATHSADRRRISSSLKRHWSNCASGRSDARRRVR